MGGTWAAQLAQGSKRISNRDQERLAPVRRDRPGGLQDGLDLVVAEFDRRHGRDQLLYGTTLQAADGAVAAARFALAVAIACMGSGS
jgi:hypothetical protein